MGNKSKAKGFAMGAVFGAAVGVVAGLLTAPKSGKETRADIKEKAGEAKDFTVKKAGEAKEFAGQKFEVAKKSGKEWKKNFFTRGKDDAPKEKVKDDAPAQDKEDKAADKE
ncbi:YtxH domain-containing protein [Candidatus Saccharibacteria bacterium]|nr:YtxH domain-containing protein [Candidatus Saccharibacteria bacterium]MCL1963359.1 YtxH domain-containing protein [Candidatus Saccharibacteria bacterium]